MCFHPLAASVAALSGSYLLSMSGYPGYSYTNHSTYPFICRSALRRKVRKEGAGARRKNLKGIKPVEGRFKDVKHYVKDQAQTEQSLF